MQKNVWTINNYTLQIDNSDFQKYDEQIKK